MLGDLRLDERDLSFDQPVPLVKLGICPLSGRWQIWHKCIHVARGVLRRLAERHQESHKSRTQVLRKVDRFRFTAEMTGNEVGLGTRCSRLGNDWLAEELCFDSRTRPLYGRHQHLPFFYPLSVDHHGSSFDPTHALVRKKLNRILQTRRRRLPHEVRGESKRLTTGDALVERVFLLRPDLLQNWHRLVAPYEDVIRIKMTRNSGTGRLPIPNCLHLAGPVMLAIPQEVGNAAANLHARETLVELRIVHNTPHSLVGKHP